MAADVKEGFLCPICVVDLGDEIQLQIHFEEKHSKEDQVFLQNLIGLFGKAKKKMLNKDVDEAEISGFIADLSHDALGQNFKASGYPDCDPVSGLHFDLAPNPPLPKIVSYTQDFKEQRKKKIERNKCTNMVLFRLEKLMRNIPNDPAKRREHEQAVVPWIEDEIVKLCPDCAKQFNVARRKHHCRLCGSVICNDCSTPVSFELANKVINPASISQFRDNSDLTEQSEDLKTKRIPNTLSKLKSKLGGSNESLNTLLKINFVGERPEDDEQFRSCIPCRSTIDEQLAKIELKLTEPILVKYYQRLQALMIEGRQMGEKYRQMAGSLNKGEEDYRLDDAKSLRLTILKIADAVHGISKEIANLDNDTGTDDGRPNSVSPLQHRLQQRIRAAAVNFVKDGLVGLPDIPNEEKYAKLKKMRKDEALRRVEEEKRASKLAKLKFEQENNHRSKAAQNFSPSKFSSSSLSSDSKKAIKQGRGLVLSTSGINISGSDDPMVQQIHNIQGFIQEAKRLGHMDEVASLESNLRELQKEYERMQIEREDDLNTQDKTDKQEDQLELENNYRSFKPLFHKNSPMEPNKHCNEEYLPEKVDDYDASGKNPFF